MHAHAGKQTSRQAGRHDNARKGVSKREHLQMQMHVPINALLLHLRRWRDISAGLFCKAPGIYSKGSGISAKRPEYQAQMQVFRHSPETREPRTSLGPRTHVRAGLPVHPGEASLNTRAEVQGLQDLSCGVS